MKRVFVLDVFITLKSALKRKWKHLEISAHDHSLLLLSLAQS